MKRLQQVMNSLIRLSQVLLLLFLIVVCCQAFRSFPEAEFLMSHASKGMTGCLLVVMTSFLALLFYIIYKGLTKLNDCVHIWIRGILIVLAFGMQLVFLCYYRSLYMWDSAFVVGGASSLLADGFLAPESLYYFGQYPNQNMFAVITKIILAIANFAGVSEVHQMIALNVFNLICIDATLAFTMLLIKEIKPDISKAAYTMAWIVILCQPIWYMGVSYYYTITMAMPFFMGFMYGGFHCLREAEQAHIKKMAMWGILSGVLLTIGILIRATSIVPAIAFWIYFVVRLILGRGDKKALGLGLIIWILTALCMMLFIKPVVNKQIGLDTTDTAFPATHWLMMSMTSPGCHNAEDEAYTASFATAQEKKVAVKARIQEKAEALGMTGMVMLGLEKVRNTWSNGTNNYVLFMENCLHMDGMYPYVFGHHKDVAVLLHQAMLLLTAIGGIFSCVYGIFAREVDTKLYVLRLTWLGGFLFYILWETGAQYSLPFLICMILCALDGYDSFAKDARIGTQIKKCGMITLGVVSLGAMLICIIVLKTPFTQEINSFKSPVVNQLIADGQIEVGENLTQTFQTDDAFNQVVFQWRNLAGAENQAVYEAALVDEAGRILRQEQIVAAEQGPQGAAIWDMDMETPDGAKTYTIQIQKVDESKDTLSFVTYTCGKYYPYPYGLLRIDEKEQAGALMFQVARNEEMTYLTPKKYVFFGGMMVSIFLILEICCILDWYRKQSD